MGFPIRSGRPHAIGPVLVTSTGDLTVNTAPVTLKLPPTDGACNRLRVANVGATPLRIFWTEADFNASPAVNYTTVAVSAIFAEDVLVDQIWLKSVGADSQAEILAIHRPT